MEGRLSIIAYFSYRATEPRDVVLTLPRETTKTLEKYLFEKVDKGGDDKVCFQVCDDEGNCMFISFWDFRVTFSRVVLIKQGFFRLPKDGFFEFHRLKIHPLNTSVIAREAEDLSEPLAEENYAFTPTTKE